MVHGQHDIVNMILDHPDIPAISFVGSDQGGMHVYNRACAKGKRVQVRGGVCVWGGGGRGGEGRGGGVVGGGTAGRKQLGCDADHALHEFLL